MSQSSQTPDNHLTDIFINYRRADTSGHAGRLEQELSERFPGRVFMDIHNIEVGKDFTEAIADGLGKCGALIVMIGNQWLNIADPKTGKRRLDKPDDLVALEIVGALERNIRVIPVLVADATMPQEEDLPPTLAGLVRRNAIEITDTRWDYDVEQLIKVLEKVCGSGPRPAEDTSNAGQSMLSGAAPGKSGALKIALISVVAALIVAVALATYLSSGKNSTPQPQAGNANLGGQASANVAAHDSTAKPPGAINRPQPQAVVKPSVIELVFPVDTSRKWEWGGVESPQTGEHEYHWEAELLGTNGYYKFSVYLNQAKKGATADFAALVNELSRAIYAWDDDKDKWIVATADVPLRLDFDATPDGLSMTVTGKDVQRFYASKSKTAIFRILMPDQKEELITVPVVYKES